MVRITDHPAHRTAAYWHWHWHWHWHRYDSNRIESNRIESTCSPLLNRIESNRPALLC
eukprot:jgi/Psemu1/315725/fgenesh1_kg.2378_\